MRIPYGYIKNNEGDILIDQERSDVIRLIFDSYQAGLSLGKIADMLEARAIPSPAGNTRWGRAAINKLLSNAKYLPLVGVECYFDVQYAKQDRSNIDENTGQRKSIRHCSPDMSDGFRLMT